MSESAPSPVTQTATPVAAETAPAQTPPPQAADAAIAARKAQEAEQIRLRGVAIRKQRDDERKKLTDENAALKAEREALTKKAADHEQWKRRALQDPEALKDLYGDKWYESLTKAKLGDDSNLQVKAMREELMAEIETLRAKDGEREKAAQTDAAKAVEAQQREEQLALADLAEETKALIESKKDTFSTLSVVGLHAEVAKRTQAAFMAGKRLDPEAAAAEVEAELDKLIETVLATPKWAKKYRAATEAPKPRKEEAPQWTPRRSIGTDMTPGSAPPPAGKLTMQQKRERALAALSALGSK